MNHATETTAERQPYLRLDQVRAMVGGVTAKTIYSWIASRGFPVGRSLAGGRVVLYSRAEVEAWIAAQPRSDAGNLGRTGLSRDEALRQLRATRTARNTVSGAAA
jgi:predicted DNA-binding transcriptional regulator AlpA